MRTIRYGIIGCGMMGGEHIRNIKLLEGARVNAVTDPLPENMEEAAALAGEDCVAYDSPEELLEKGDCDALLLASPNHTHFGILKTLLKSGLPILAEKPLCINHAECQSIVEMHGGKSAPVWVAMEYRYMPPVQRLIQAVRSNEVGQVRMIAIREHRFPFLKKFGDWNRFAENTGGTLVEKCCHFFDLMRLIAQSEPVRVYASGGMDVNFLEERYEGRRPDILDNAFVTVDFENGVRALLELCMFNEGSYWQERVSAVGDAGSVEARVPGPARFSTDGKERESEVVFAFRADKRIVREPVKVDHSVLAAGDHHGSTYFQHRKFLDMVRNGGEPEVSLADGLISVAMGEAAELSAKTGQAIDFRAYMARPEAA